MIPTTITSEQLSLGISSHHNHYLFSDHYLNFILKNDPRWKQAVADGEVFLDWITAVFQHEHDQFPNYSESQLEEHWFKPIFKQLGHVFEGQAQISALIGSGVKVPDYVFFSDETARQQAVKTQQTADYVQHALAVGEVKKWGISLGKKSKGAPTFDNNNPSFQIDYYLRATDLTWGILSNGRLWRLVHKDTSYKLDIYFEIDVLEMIEQQNRAAAVFFVLFFRQSAFRPDTQGRIFLQDALETSAAYALQLEADLRDNAYKALEHLIQGFIEPQVNGLTADSLPTIYTNSLYLLYRIIFLFYGESRGLLPIAKPEYQSYSLTKLARDIATRLDSGYKAPPMTNEYWGRLKQLFTIISGEQPDLNTYLGVPRYNGGLFNPQLHPFLEQHFVGDRFLLAAIDAIARREVGEKKEERRREPVDYRTLGVRQLGSIYEGLLEYQPRRAVGPMVVVKIGKGEEWLPESQKSLKTKVLDRRNVGDIYLVTDKGERKATGSYYTPDYIVKYMVEQALGPLVNDRRQQTAVRSDRLSSSETAETVTTNRESFAEGVLKLNILDPAMGSGHFLVEATDFLARAIATDAATLQPPAGSEPAGGSEEDDLVYWRRQVVERCIYGVDKNPMAVELAKLSLWLVTVARDKPLSFLDHHLRHGDSLVGAHLADLSNLPAIRPDRSARRVRSEEQPSLFDESAFTQDAFRAVGGMVTIEKMLSESIEDIYHKEILLAQLQAHLSRWRRLADLWISYFFGNELTAESYADLARFLQGQPALLNDSQRETFLNHPAVQKNDYFHWELEFPEIFWDEFGRFRGEQAGFDAVIGNPPYVRQETLAKYKLFFAHHYPKYHHSMADLYVYFIGYGCELAKQNGILCYITSGTFRTLKFGALLRHFLASQKRLEFLVDFGEQQVFSEATTYPVILQLRNAPPPTDGSFEVYHAENLKGNGGFRVGQPVPLPKGETNWVLINGRFNRLFYGWEQSQSLGQVIQQQIYRGLTTGLNTAFVIDETARKRILEVTPSAASLIKPFVRGENLATWYIKQSGEWIILIPAGWTNKTLGTFKNENNAWSSLQQAYPAITQHLEPFAEKAKERYDQGDYWWELRPCNYYEAFESPRIHSTKISLFPTFSLSYAANYPANTSYVLSVAHENQGYYLLGLLNSRVFEFYARHIFAKKANGYFEIQPDRLADFPIPEASTENQNQVQQLAKAVSALAQQRYDLNQKTRHRIQIDLGTAEKNLNHKLMAWWELDFSAFRQQIKTVFKRDIPLKERDEWETWLAAQRAQHQQLTAEIITHETTLNRLVYDLYELNTAEIALIETSTRYPYGAV